MANEQIARQLDQSGDQKFWDGSYSRSQRAEILKEIAKLEEAERASGTGQNSLQKQLDKNPRVKEAKRRMRMRKLGL